ncbi:hypothetical protein MKY27_01625 [Solibacillus sp. FSL R5-0449]|uniref:hypothetical protein n=1 Tax=Solibacillus sp. FSL R5-0449 TaxID=2921639 RepID=UPI0030CD3982
MEELRRLLEEVLGILEEMAMLLEFEGNRGLGTCFFSRKMDAKTGMPVLLEQWSGILEEV